MESFDRGRRSSVADDVQVVQSGRGRLRIGDYCRIGPGVKFVLGDADISIGDWTTLHDNTLVLGGEGVTVGQHGWFGQNCILDGTGGLRVGRGVRVGMYSQIWSHVAAGEQLEGCTLIGERPVVIEDDVWLVGSCIVASGVTLGRKLVALIGSNITKSFPASTVIAGAPAKQKDNLAFYRDVSLSEKYVLLRDWVSDIASSRGWRFEADDTGGVVRIGHADDRVLFVRDQQVARSLAGNDPSATVCCIETKRYNKVWSDTEEAVLRALSGNKARFYA
jgi:acetyltransferase-like isoleucine patch superfamily enzyme